MHKNKNKFYLAIGYGSGHVFIETFPSKASPVTLNFSVLSAHYNTLQVNDSLVYCNGKYVANFTVESSAVNPNTFSIGSISTNAPLYDSQKQIAHFSLHHGRLSRKDILRMHKYLCERYRIDHDPISTYIYIYI